MLSFLLLTTFLSLCVPTFALPAPFERRGPSVDPKSLVWKLMNTGVSASQLSQFALYEQYAAAAYCKTNNDDSAGSIVCAGNCPLVEQAGAKTILEFQDLGVADATGFIAVDSVNKLIVLSYRGSASLSNWISNVNIDFNTFSPCSGCQVHAGFLSSWNDSKDQIKASLNQAQSQYPGYSIIFSGHSLGGAISTLAAADLRQQGFNIALYTYGSPMVGNDKFANFVTKQSGGNYRITHAFDAVPKLPGYLLNYRHVSPEYWLTTPSGGSVGTGDIKISSGIFNLLGNGGTLISTISDHLWYFNSISACTGGFVL